MESGGRSGGGEHLQHVSQNSTGERTRVHSACSGPTRLLRERGPSRPLGQPTSAAGPAAAQVLLTAALGLGRADGPRTARVSHPSATVMAEGGPHDLIRAKLLPRRSLEPQEIHPLLKLR